MAVIANGEEITLIRDGEAGYSQHTCSSSGITLAIDGLICHDTVFLLKFYFVSYYMNEAKTNAAAKLTINHA